MRTMDLALETARMLDIQIIVLNELYLINGVRLPSTPGWQKVCGKVTTILVEDNMKYTKLDAHSNNTVAVEISGTRIISTYLLPNEDLKDKLLVLHNLLLGSWRVVLAGDFNCWHQDFCSQRLRRRDRAFQQLLLDHNLSIANYVAPTREQQGVATTWTTRFISLF